MNEKSVCGIMLTLLIVSTLVLGFEVQPTRAEPTTIIVPDDHPTIQDATDSANEGDTIFVRAGVYSENLWIGTDGLTLIGEDRSTYVVSVSIHASDVTLSGFTVLGDQHFCVDIYAGNRNTLVDNTIGSDEGQPVELGIGGHGSDNTISRNMIRNCREGIALGGSYNNVVNNTITPRPHAMEFGILLSGAYNTICDNIVTNTHFGIELHDSHHNTIAGNAIANCQEHGLGLCDSDENTVLRNAISGNLMEGLAILGSDLNVIRENSVIDNGHMMGWDIFLYDWSANNRIFHNDFWHPYIGILEGADTSWDDGYPSGGNSWHGWDACPPPSDFDRYSGPNQDQPGSDGIVDEPYVIDDLNRDNYPLVCPRGPFPLLRMEPWSWIHPVGRTITFDASRSFGGEIIEYYFDYGDGSVSGWTTDPVQVHSYKEVGEYCAKALVLDAWGRKAWSYMLRLTIIPAAEPDFEIQVSPDSQIGQPPPPDQIDSSVYYQVKITSKNDFSSSITFSVSFSPFPEHIGWNDPASVTPPPNEEATTTLEVNIYSDTPLKTFKVTVTATSQEIIKSDTVRLSVERSLEVPYQHQDNTAWCGVTCLAMVLHYYDFDFHNWDYANLEHLSTDEGAYPDDERNFLLEYYYPQVIPDEEWKLYDEDGVRSSISDGYPIILHLSGTPEADDHAVVAVGYNETGLFVNDPSGALFDDTQYLGWHAGDPRYPKSLNHAYLDWDNVQLFAKLQLSVRGIPTTIPSGSMWMEDKTSIVFEHQNSEHQLHMSRGLHWVDKASGKDDSVIPLGSSLSIRLYVSNSHQEPQLLTGYAYIMSEGHVVAELGSDSSPVLSGFHYDELDYVGPDPLISWYIADIDQCGLSKGIQYYLEVDLCDSNGMFTDSVYSAPFYYKSAQSAKLKENHHHLFLHVYDPQGRHVGLNYVTGQIELEIPDSYYRDDGNGSIIIVVPHIFDLMIVVDAAYAEDPLESFDLTVTIKTDLGVFSETCSGNIIAGESHTFRTQVSEAGLELYLLVDIDFDPDTLNLKSNGAWITAFIELPEGYDVEDIDISMIMLNNTIPADLDAPTQIGDYDLDGVVDLMVKFNRASIVEWLGTIDYSEETAKRCSETLVITGEVLDVTFHGLDAIEVFHK